MDYLFSIIKGMIRGLAEFSAVSATGHGAIFEKWLAFPRGIPEEWMSLGLIGLILALYHRNIWGMLAGLGQMVPGLFKGTFKWRKASRHQVMAVNWLLACLPLAVAALVRRTAVDYVARFSGNLFFTGLMMLITGGLLFLGDHSLDQKKELRDMKPIEGIKLGLFGAFALMPGLSPLATALAMALNMGFKRKDALEFALLMCIPCFLAGGPIGAQGGDPLLGGLAAAAAVIAGLAGLFLLKWLLKKDRLSWLAYYCGIAGVGAIVLNFIV